MTVRRPLLYSVATTLCLLVVAMLTAGGGHGTYVFADLYGAPFSLLGTAWSFLGIALVWPTLFAVTKESYPRWWLILGLLVHCVGAAIVLQWSDIAEWSYFRQIADLHPEVQWLGFAAYGIALVVLLTRIRATPSSEDLPASSDL